MLRPILIILVLALLIGGGVKLFEQIPQYKRATVGRQIAFWVGMVALAIVVVLSLKAMF